MSFAGGLAGLSAIGPGYTQGRTDMASADIREMQADESRDSALAKVAMGNALALLSRAPGIGGTPPMDMGLPAPQPGQASMPGPGAGPPMQMAGGPGAPLTETARGASPAQLQLAPQGGGTMLPLPPQMMGGPAPAEAARGASPAQLQITPQGGGAMLPLSPQMMGGAPGMPMPGGPPGQPPMPGGPPRPQPQLDWRQVMHAVTAANPGINPAVAAEAVTKFLPIMSQQAQMEWRGNMLMMREHSINQQMERLNRREDELNARHADRGAQRDQKLDIDRDAEERKGRQGDRRLDQGDERIGISQGESERKTRQGDTRIDQGQQRVDINKGESERKARQGDTRIEQGQQRIDQNQNQFNQREQRLEKTLKLREDSQNATLEQRKTEAAARVEATQGKQGLAEWRAAVDQQYKYIRQRIEAYSGLNTMNQKQRTELLAEAEANYRKQLDDMRNRAGSSTERPAQGGSKAAGDRVPPPAAGAPGVPKALSPDVKAQFDAAIKAGKPKDALIQRLREQGYDTGGL